MRAKHKLVVLTGSRGTGKTTTAIELFRHSKQRGLLVAGFAEIKNEAAGYTIKNLPTEEEFVWAKENSPVCAEESEQAISHYLFYDHIIPDVARSLSSSLTAPINHHVFFFDEFGRLEINGKGLITIFDDFALAAKSTIIVVQKKVLTEFTDHYSQYFNRQKIFNLDQIKSKPDLFTEIDHFLG